MELVVRVPWPCVTRRRGCVVQASKSSSNEPMADGSASGASGVVGADSFRKSTFAHCFLPRQTPTTRPRNGDFASKTVGARSAKFFRRTVMAVTYVRQCQRYITTHGTHERSP
jgi:hypothetical protein